MSESEDRGEQPVQEAMTDLLSAFSLGPAWAKIAESNKSAAAKYQGREHETRDGRGARDERGRGGRDERGRGGRDERGRGGHGERGGFRGERGHGGRDERGGRRDGRRDDERGRAGGRSGVREFREEAEPPKGVRVEIRPAVAGVHAVAKEILHLARVYSLYEIAKVLLAARDRYQAKFSAKEPAGPLYVCLKDGSLWMSRQEALAHLWKAEWLSEYYVEEEVEIDPPKGNFQGVARCGISGVYLGPPNYHGYQTAIRQLHRERFGHMTFEQYASKVRTERGEEAVNAWLATMSKTTHFRATGMPDEPQLATRADVERHFAEHYFAGVFAETREASVSGNIAARHLSPPLLTVLKGASAHARKHPATIIPDLCRGLEKEHLPIFKRQGKLFTGPARPHPLDEETVLADRPAAICRWLAEHPEAKLADLWKAVLPEGQTEPGEEWLRDLFWLLSQGHILLLQDDTLVLPVRRPRAEQPSEPAPKKKRKRNRKRRGRPLGMVKAKLAEMRKAGATKRPLRVVQRKHVPREEPEVGVPVVGDAFPADDHVTSVANEPAQVAVPVAPPVAECAVVAPAVEDAVVAPPVEAAED